MSIWVRIESWVIARTDMAVVEVAREQPASSVDYGLLGCYYLVHREPADPSPL